jgi:restriction system protein
MFSQAELKDRGWSLGLIRTLLGPPDKTTTNPVFRSKLPVKLWERSRVEEAETRPEFIVNRGRRDRYSSSARASADKKRHELLDKVGSIEIEVNLLPIDKLYSDAISEWENLGAMRGDYERDGRDADESTKKRWAVNYVRHNLLYASHDLFLGRGQVGVREAQAALEGKMYDAIARSYPELADVARNQAHRLWGISQIARSTESITLAIASVIIPEKAVTEGILIRSTSEIWFEIAKLIGHDWKMAYTIPADKWEEIIAGAFWRDGYDEVILTPRSGDHGRDIIAIRRGIGSVKILGSVKAYAAKHLVSYDDVRALYGVVSADRSASKGIITTTSDFPPKIMLDPFIAPLVPTRLELVNGDELQAWLLKLATE